MKWGQPPFPGRTWLPAMALLAAAAIADESAEPLLFDDFEAHETGRAPGPPWKEETYKSGAVVTVDGRHTFSGSQAMHVVAPAGANYRRGYVAIHLRGTFPQLQSGMFGRAMVWLDEVPGASPVHWTLLQGEGRSADDRYNSIYRLGLLEQGGRQLMANFETTPPVKTDCRQRSALTLPVRRWACIEWRFEAASDESQFWIDGNEITHVKGRATAADACRGHDLEDRWLAPPRFDSLYMGFERYGDTVNDQNLWIDDVALSTRRVGCPGREK